MSEPIEMSITPEVLRRVVEGALLAAAQPLSEDRLLSLFDEEERPEKALLREVLEQIIEDGAGRGFELKQVASGWRFQVPEDLAPWVNKLWEEKPQKYSRATLETLAIIAYRQPITRGDIEEIRGVAVSSHIVKSLTERGWIKVVGQRDVPGKPSLYATTREFLDYFNLRSLDDLPTLAEIRDIDSLNAALDLGEAANTDSAEGTAGDGSAGEGAAEDQEPTADQSDEAYGGGQGAPEAPIDESLAPSDLSAEDADDGQQPQAAEAEDSLPAVHADYAEAESTPEADIESDHDSFNQLAERNEQEVQTAENDDAPVSELQSETTAESEQTPSGDLDADEPQVRESQDT
ncbi:SMC-Scp complex subunit ScpB [Microbulbifer sp.]|uniref:SMC-Scp complex subunit ScpB n=1 Tax=Microbulbifer sp. TaxID=1908541 RepID=UPI00258500BD|nr:SMC-Scp complex subunit ScpB [Microbulbifer sp.]